MEKSAVSQAAPGMENAISSRIRRTRVYNTPRGGQIYTRQIV